LELSIKDVMSGLFKIMRIGKSSGGGGNNGGGMCSSREDVADPHILGMMKYFLLSNDEKNICKCSATPLQDSDSKDLA
jgi:hypothetical protein